VNYTGVIQLEDFTVLLSGITLGAFITSLVFGRMMKKTTRDPSLNNIVLVRTINKQTKESHYYVNVRRVHEIVDIVLAYFRAKISGKERILVRDIRRQKILFWIVACIALLFTLHGIYLVIHVRLPGD
jgi:hypothetical protein